ncbi:hypothetical protein GCM10018790_77830 [Kitasatospora xanthocidica]|uniref:hypothetical protein n=1 Tax=Kitasatospora xanthocidica TaxID=83382 RepID=UPI0016719D0A|nr:hypothetical protein [Kitasatospora xanthocidica]GHF88908.1 hypothetical protein GCM10018790_77830 [Kitasatospora xanthocidica]
MEPGKRYDVLALDYAMAREDERTFFNIQVAVAAITVALLAGLATFLSDTCQLGAAKPCKNPPAALLAAAPSIPLAALALLQILGASAALRSYYMRALEKELRHYAVTPLPELEPVAEIRSPSYAGLLAEQATLRRGRSGYRVLAIMIMLITFFAFASMTVYIAVKLDERYRISMLIVYGVAFGFLVLDVASVTLGARSTFIRVARRFARRQDHGLFEGASLDEDDGRSLGAYLLLPRPEDWAKWLFIPLAFVTTSWERGRGFHWENMVLAVLVAEFLVYSARYQWNDIRGLEHDSGHPLNAERLRLPRVGSRKHARFVVYSSLIVAALRLLAALVVGLALGRTDDVLILMAVVFGLAVVYEALRGWEDEHPAAARSLWLIVGVGYAVRFLVGAFAASEPPYSVLSVVASFYFYCFGVMFVLMTWLLEGTSFCRAASEDSWYVPQGALRGKTHVRLLLAYLGSPHVDHLSVLRLPGTAPGVVCGERRVLEDSRKLRTLLAPWNIAFLAAVVMSAPTGVLLAGGRLEPARTAVAVLLALAAGWMVMVGSRALRLTAAVSGAAALSLVLTRGLEVESAQVLVVAPWLLSTITYITFRQQSYVELKSFAKGLAGALRSTLLTIVGKIIGEDTWRRIR